jgi:hypothetical protein
MTLHAYGDSWTEGQGTILETESKITDRDELMKFRKEFSYVKFLAEKVGIPYVNNGISGQSNLKIFNKIVSDVKNKIVTSDDLVIIMFSSSLRDTVNFLPNSEWISWSVGQLINTPNGFINSYISGDDVYDDFLKKYKELYVGELFNQNYYNIVNQKYIIFLQKILKHYKIKYIMCDAFENMIKELHPKDDLTKHIDQKVYWNFGKKTFRDFLFERSENDLWEFPNTNKDASMGIHPNINGYKLIYEELYGFLKNLKYV